MNREACPSRDLLLAYETAELPESSVQPLIAHISDCPACQADLETLCAVDDMLIARLREPPTIDPYETEPECREAVLRMQQLAAQACRGRDLPHTRAIKPTIVGQLGEYELLEKLGEGGMGVVYKARHTKLKRLVALKVLPKTRMHHEGAIARFEREMEAIGRVNHANIVQAYDAREIDGTWVLVMEYVDGVDLDGLVRRHGPLPIPDACELIRQAATGLQYAHERGLIHRDIKPSNLMLNRQGQVKVLDLGLALLAADQPASDEITATQPTNTELTNSQQIMGTAGYMAPEQANDSHQVDTRADIYGLGCTLYKLLIGRPPFGDAGCRTPLDQILAHRSKTVEPIGQLRQEVGAELAAVIQRMLAKSPAERFAKPAEVTAALKPWTTGSDLIGLLGGIPGERKVKLVGPAARAVSPPGRSRRLALAAGGAAAIVLLGIVILISTGKGTVKLEFADAEAARQCTVSIDGDAIRLEKLGDPIKLWPGEHMLRVKRGDLEIEAREFEVLRHGQTVVTISSPARSPPYRSYPVRPFRASVTPDPLNTALYVYGGKANENDRESVDRAIAHFRESTRSRTEFAQRWLYWASCWFPLALRNGEKSSEMVFVYDMSWVLSTCGVPGLPAMRDVNTYGEHILIVGMPYPRAIWTTPFTDGRPADIVLDVADRQFATFKAHVGPWDSWSDISSLQFQVLTDGVVKLETSVLRSGEIQNMVVDVSGAKQVVLRVVRGDANPGVGGIAAWGASRFIKSGAEDPLEVPPAHIESTTDVNTAFFLAEVHWRLDHKELARRWYDKAVEWMEKNKSDDEELCGYRDEAAKVLGIGEKPALPKEEGKKP